MLQKNTVTAELWELLQQLMQIEELNQFYLVGGTSLSLRRGHRESIDIDLFTSKPFNGEFLRQVIDKYFPDNQLLVSYSYMIQWVINGVKVDIVNNGIENIYPVELIDNIRIASELDVTALKLNAVTGRGAKKDFIDLYMLLQYYKLEELLDVFQKKIPRTDLHIVLRSIEYFADADLDAMPRTFLKIKWDEMKKFLLKEVKDYYTRVLK